MLLKFIEKNTLDSDLQCQANSDNFIIVCICRESNMLSFYDSLLLAISWLTYYLLSDSQCPQMLYVFCNPLEGNSHMAGLQQPAFSHHVTSLSFLFPSLLLLETYRFFRWPFCHQASWLIAWRLQNLLVFGESLAQHARQRSLDKQWERRMRDKSLTLQSNNHWDEEFGTNQLFLYSSF